MVSVCEGVIWASFVVPYSFSSNNRCIPYRLIENHEDHSTDLEKSIEVLMISSPNRSDLVFPKVKIPTFLPSGLVIRKDGLLSLLIKILMF